MGSKVLRHEIFEAFKVANIEIPFPQTDLHIRSDFRAPSAGSLPAETDGDGEARSQ